MRDYVTHTHVKATGGKFTHTHLSDGADHTHDYLRRKKPQQTTLGASRPGTFQSLYDGYYSMAENMRRDALGPILMARRNRYNAGDRSMNLQAQVSALEDFLSTSPADVVESSL